MTNPLTIKEYGLKHQLSSVAVKWLQQRLSNDEFRKKHNISRIKKGASYVYDQRQLNKLIRLYNESGSSIKTVVEYIIQGDYGDGIGWEDICSYDNKNEAYCDVQEYRKDGYEASYRIIQRRVPNPDYNPNL